MLTSSSWDKTELFASRVVMSSASNEILKLRNPAKPPAWLEAPPWQSSTELSKIIDNLPSGDKLLTETEAGAQAWRHRWDALSGFTLLYPDIHDESLQQQPGARLADELPGSDNVGFVSLDEHADNGSVEDATTELVSAFLRHALIHCPLQGIDASAPKVLLQFSGIR
ncbi:hypothetical protein MAPG_08361 [Magnaporthiopsis poae ATCC 64411]|uniref:Uncharacterized protein n=1 Tax=Magnaporthiopsis poae (strain ATCC 64411 / 73-15) TaxID=644358 RepID=A0A0C4E759_MAGP6|nr:hypothetical protein MAPG_08361 [Magnaporthiopsis poae ATCC 64411]